jgi:hypothetical protein
MRYHFPHRRRPAGLINLVAAFLVGMFIYRKGVEAGKKTGDHKENPS